MSNPINRHNELRVLLEGLKLTAMATSFADLALKAAKEGLLALQLHAGQPMTVEFKNLRLKPL